MIDWTALDITISTHALGRKRVTRDEFLRECAERSNSTVEQVLEYHDIQPCDCAEPDCPGWKANYFLKNKRERRSR